MYTVKYRLIFFQSRNSIFLRCYRVECLRSHISVMNLLQLGCCQRRGQEHKLIFRRVVPEISISTQIVELSVSSLMIISNALKNI